MHMLPSADSGACGAPARRGRQLADLAAKARGRTPLKYEITIIPFFCSELPSGLGRLSFVWERGQKVFATEAQPVNPHTRACFWSQHLRQTVTVYHDGAAFVAKEYTLKVQAVTRRSHGHEERRTVGKARLDVAGFCSTEVEPLPREVFLQLRPAGKLKVSIKAGWLKDAPMDADAMTEASGFTGVSADGTTGGGAAAAQSYQSRGGGGFDEQDLSGFEAASGGSAVGDGLRQNKSFLGDTGRSSALSGGRPPQQPGQHQRAAPAGAAAAAHRPESSAGSVSGSPRIGAVGASRPRAAGEIPPFEPPLSAEQQREEIERQKAQVMQAAQQHIEAMRHDMEAAYKGELQLAVQARNGGGLCNLLCCCWPRSKGQSIVATTEMAGLEVPEWSEAGAVPAHVRRAASAGPMLPPTTAEL